MSINIRDINKTSDNAVDFGGRHCFNLSNGNVVAVVRDEGTAGAERIYIYESSDRANWTLQVTVTPWTDNPAKMTCALSPDNDIHIVLLESGTRNTLKYCRVNYSGWSAGGWSTVDTLSGDNTFRDFDIEIADDGTAYIAAGYDKGDSSPYGFYLYSRPGGTWTPIGSHDAHSGKWVAGCEAISVVAPTTQIVGGVTCNVVFVAFGYSQGKNDQGVHIFRTAADPSTGGLHPALDSAGAGIYAKGEGNAASGYREGRLVRFFRHPTDHDSVILGIMHAEVNRKMFAIRLNTLVNQTNTNVTPCIQTNATKAADIGGRYMGMTVGGSTLQFLYAISTSKFKVRTIMSFSAHLQDDGNYGTVLSPRGTFYLSNGAIANQSVTMISSGGQKNSRSTLGDIVLLTARSDTNRHFYTDKIRTGIFEAPGALNPGNGGTSTSSNPLVTCRLKYGDKYMQTGMTAEFQLATDSSFSSPFAVFKGNSYLLVDNPDSATGAIGIVGNQVPDDADITPAVTTFMRARTLDDMGNYGPFSTTVSFTVAHPPTASNLKPSDGTIMQSTTDNRVMFSWTFNDTSDADTQLAYQVQVLNASAAVVADTGKINSDAKFAIIDLSAYLDQDLSWKVSLWDNWNSQGPFTVAQAFKIEEPPTVVISSPVVGEDVGTPVAHVVFSATTAGGATIKSTRVVITQGSLTVFTSGNQPRANDPSGTVYTVDSPGQVFHNLGKYTITAYATDSRGFQGRSTPVQMSASWVPPDMPTTLPVIDLTHFGVEGEGYVVVTWDDSGKATDFVLYVLQRKDDLIDTFSNIVLQEGEWKDVATIYDNDATYEYHDYVAPSTNYKVSYRVLQGVTIFNDVVLSDPGAAGTAYPMSDSYWLVDPDLSGSLLLHVVTEDSYTEEYETESYHVIGRGNHVDYGDRLGYNGSLSAQFRNTGGTSARSKKMALEDVRKNRRSLYLRTPFGDVKLVSVGDVQVSRIAGVGVDEFCDVSIPYLEVGP